MTQDLSVKGRVPPRREPLQPLRQLSEIRIKGSPVLGSRPRSTSSAGDTSSDACATAVASRRRSNDSDEENERSCSESDERKGRSTPAAPQSGCADGPSSSLGADANTADRRPSDSRGSLLTLSRKARSLTRKLRESIVKRYGSVRAAFKSIDTDNSKSITMREFQELIKNRNLATLFSEDDAKEVFNLIDVDGNGEVSLEEAIQILDVGHQSIEEFEASERDRREENSSTSTRISQEVYTYITTKFSTVRSAFRSFDPTSFDRDGTVMLRKFGEAIKCLKLQGVTDNDVEKFVRNLDEDGSDRIDYSEFLTKFDKPVVYTDGLYNPFMSHCYKITVGAPKTARKLKPHERLRARLVAKQLVGVMETQFGTPVAFFRHLDENKDGAISNEELHQYLTDSKLNITDGDRDAFIHYCDSNGTGYISLADFTSKFGEYAHFSELTMPPWLASQKIMKADKSSLGDSQRVRTAPTVPAANVSSGLEMYQPPRTPGRFDHTHKWVGRGGSLTTSDASSSWYASDKERFQRKGRQSISREQIIRTERQPLAGSKWNTGSMSATNTLEDLCEPPPLYGKYARQFARFDRARVNEQRIIDSYEREEQRMSEKREKRCENYAAQKNRFFNKLKTITDVMYYNDSWRDNTDDSKFDKITQNISRHHNPIHRSFREAQ